MIIGEIMGSTIKESIENILYAKVSFFSVFLNAAIAWNIPDIRYSIFKILNATGIIDST